MSMDIAQNVDENIHHKEDFMEQDEAEEVGKDSSLALEQNEADEAGKDSSLMLEQDDVEEAGKDTSLTQEQITQLKMKREMHLKKRIKSEAVEETNIKNIETEEEKKSIYSIKVWQTRANCMQSKNTDFGYLCEVGMSMRNKILGIKTQEEKQADEQKVLAQKPVVAIRYDRYDQEVFSYTNDLNIDAGMSFISQPSFLPVAPKIQPIKQEPQQVALKKRTNRTPIIIVPSTLNMSGSLINMYNAKEILQDFTYVSIEEKKSKGAKREIDFMIHRKREGQTVSYRVLDNVSRLNEEQWERVVGVFVMGPLWQFKGWKWQGNPAEIFAHIPGFYIYYEDMKIDPNIAKWNVTRLAISRDKRHLDRARIMKFWEVVDRHIKKNKPQLRG